LSPDGESENGGPKCNDVCVHRVERGVAGRKKGRDTKEVLARAWYARQLAQANETQPIAENHAVGPFLEVRAGRFTARRAKETLAFKVRGESAVEIIKAGSEDEGVAPSLGFVSRARSCSMSASSSLPRGSGRMARKSATSIPGLCTGP
jgi:hypothetical protein